MLDYCAMSMDFRIKPKNKYIKVFREWIMLIFLIEVPFLLVGGHILCRLFLGGSNELQSYISQWTETAINLWVKLGQFS